jgi:hypothetical protein
MGQKADNKRNAALDEKKVRAAGRASRTGQNKPGQGQIRDAAAPQPMKGKTGGAFGKTGRAEPRARATARNRSS